MYAAVRQCEIDAWEAIASFRDNTIYGFLQELWIRADWEELLSLDDKCGKFRVFKTLWKRNNFEEALTKQPTFFLYWILYTCRILYMECTFL